LLAYLAGVDEIYSMGLLDSSQTLSLDKLVLDNHLARELEMAGAAVPFRLSFRRGFRPGPSGPPAEHPFQYVH
jgi:hypothetical protein